jgi:hypothetical protein
MPKGDKPASTSDHRERDLAELIRKARENPGVREVMEVHERAQGTVTQAQPHLRTGTRSVQSVNDRTSG